MWAQVAGKIALALTPRVNHYWNVAFQVTSRGLVTPVMNADGRAFTILFDFIDHRLVLHVSDGHTEEIQLQPRSVADFYRAVMDALGRLHIGVRIWSMPVEVPNPVRFEHDTVHHTYDPVAAHAMWRALVAMKPVFDRFRSEFIGKCSPLHLFGGGFDLAVTRFSGRRAPERPGADAVTRESYSHEVISHGFWFGSEAIPEPSFYAYAAPEPAGFKDSPVRPAAAHYTSAFGGLFVLPYDAARSATSPESELMSFLHSTYENGATLGGWNRHELERSAA
jgi:hypothetical protein